MEIQVSQKGGGNDGGGGAADGDEEDEVGRSRGGTVEGSVDEGV